MKLSHILILSFLALVILVSGCVQKQDATATTTPETQVQIPAEKLQPTEVKLTCDDGNACTTDIFNALTKTCEHTTTANCCGNDKCEDGERCDAETHKTTCTEDCSLRCEGFLVTHKTATGTTEDEFPYACTDSNCEQMDEKDFHVFGNYKSTGVKTVVSNIGEKYVTSLTSTFYCQELYVAYPDQATFDGGQIKGIVVKDYFNDFKEKVDSLPGSQTGQNSATYYLAFDTINIKASTDVRCVITLQAPNYKNAQDIIINFEKPASSGY